MLIDYIDIEHLPRFVVWLDWCYYAHSDIFKAVLWLSFLWNEAWLKSLKGFLMTFSVGCLVWLFWCFLTQGTAVG